MRLFVISDLHLGGRPHEDGGTPGSQICHAYGELAALIDAIADQGEQEAVELVVNGDIVDFLMEDDYGGNNPAVPWMPDEQAVLGKLKLIIERTGGAAGPFGAMRRLLERGRQVTFILGNHDVELSLPAVRRYLEEEVLGGGGRFRFIYDGEAYVRGDVLIEHGNRYDPWNIVDHSALRQERAMLSRGMGGRMGQRVTGRFIPPPGSFMVTQVLNHLKGHYRFIDLLKPENHAVVPILLAIHPNLKHVLGSVLRLYYAQSGNEMFDPVEPCHDGQLSAGGQAGRFDLHASLRLALGDDAGDLFQVAPDVGQPLGASGLWSEVRKLSAHVPKYFMDTRNFFAGAAAPEAAERLRHMLRLWRGKLMMDEGREEKQYADAARTLAAEGGFNCIVFGHTHLPKSMELAVSGRSVTYLNTGTWADTMRIAPELLEPGAGAKDEFAAFLDDLRTNKLDRHVDADLRYAEIRLVNDRVVEAKLCRHASGRRNG